MNRLILRTTVRVRSAGGAVGNPDDPLTVPGDILTMFATLGGEKPQAGMPTMEALSTHSSFIAVSLCASSEGSGHVSWPFTSDA